jgi:signal transduction histidine kinase
MILAPHRRLVAQKIHRPTGIFLRSLGGILTHLAAQQVSRAGRWSLTKPRPPPRKRLLGNQRAAVADSGIGIDPAGLERLFEPSAQADVATTRLYGGTGLGLAITRELVELMGGTITAQSEPG